MLRSAASKAMWVGRTTAAVIGLAIALAIVFGVATMALAAVPGDPFKLGKVNSINRVSSLVGTATSPMLRVVNKGTGPALDLRVQPGKPPLTTNSTGRVPRLNSDMVDGKHAGAFLPKGGKAADSDKLDGKDPNELVRSGLGVSQTAFSFASFTNRTSVTVNAPGKGFVIANGAVYARTSSSSCNPCYAHIEILNSTTNERSAVLIESLGNGTTALQDDVLPTTWVFPVDPGDNTFQLRTALVANSAAIEFVNPRLSAVYVPYGATGASTLGASSQQASPMSGEGKESEDGTIRK